MNPPDRSANATAFTKDLAQRALLHLDSDDRAAVDAWHAHEVAEARQTGLQSVRPFSSVGRSAMKVGLAVGLAGGFLAWIAGSGRAILLYPTPVVVRTPAPVPTPVVCPAPPVCPAVPVCPVDVAPVWAKTFQSNGGEMHAMDLSTSVTKGMTCYWPAHTPTVLCVRADNETAPGVLPPMEKSP